MLEYQKVKNLIEKGQKKTRLKITQMSIQECPQNVEFKIRKEILWAIDARPVGSERNEKQDQYPVLHVFVQRPHWFQKISHRFDPRTFQRQKPEKKGSQTRAFTAQKFAAQVRIHSDLNHLPRISISYF